MKPKSQEIDPEVEVVEPSLHEESCAQEETRTLLRESLSSLFERNPTISQRLKNAAAIMDESIGNVAYLKAKYLGEVEQTGL